MRCATSPQAERSIWQFGSALETTLTVDVYALNSSSTANTHLASSITAARDACRDAGTVISTKTKNISCESLFILLKIILIRSDIRFY